MKKLFLISIVLFISSVSLSLSAQTRVSGYFKSNGTYVQPHVRSSRNSTNHDNWSTRGNMNPYTGSTGSIARDYTRSAYNYGSGRTIIQVLKEDNTIGIVMAIKHTFLKERTMALPTILIQRQGNPFFIVY